MELNEFSHKTDDQANKKYLPVFEAVEKLINKNDPVIVAIEGRCGSGKTTLAELLEAAFDCTVFHMDDFFLPVEMKTVERLNKPGGNVHYERFRKEIIDPLLNRQDVNYRPYNCASRELAQLIHTKPKQLVIVEGVYCLHPTLQQAYDYKIFLTIDPQIQKKRIVKRSGKAMLHKFINQWIPLEEQYFTDLNIESKCDKILDTSNL